MGGRAVFLQPHAQRPREHTMAGMDEQPVLLDEAADGAVPLGAPEPALPPRRGLHVPEPQGAPPEERALGAHRSHLSRVPPGSLKTRRGASAPARALQPRRLRPRRLRPHPQLPSNPRGSHIPRQSALTLRSAMSHPVIALRLTVRHGSPRCCRG
jgi:hypothetical protein